MVGGRGDVSLYRNQWGWGWEESDTSRGTVKNRGVLDIARSITR